MDEQKVLSFWQKPQVQALVTHALGASGVIGGLIIHVFHWLGWPTPDLGTMTQYVIMGVPLLISGAWSWYHDHPDNIAARLIKAINGGEVSDHVVAKVAAVANDNADKTEATKAA